MKKWRLITIVIIFVAALTVMPTTITSGLNYCNNGECGINFWGAHEHDGVWHLAVTRMLMDGHGQKMPTMAGESLAGYNTMLDWVLAILSKISHLSISNWYFRIVPIFWFILFIALINRINKTYKINPYFLPFAIIFGMLGTSFAYLITLVKNNTLIGSSSLLSMQSALTLFNPQLGLSLLCLMGYLLVISKKKYVISDYLKIGILLAVSLGLKFYTGMIMSIMILFWFLPQLKIELVSLKRLVLILACMGVPTLIVVFMLYAPSSGSFPLIWKPFAPINLLIEDKTLLYLPMIANRLYSSHGASLLLTELVILGLFIIMNFGSRIFGIISLFMIKKRFSMLDTQLLIGTISGLGFAVLFVQRGVWWNTVQFLHVALFLGGILSALGLVKVLERNSSFGKWGVALILLITMIPNIDVLMSYIRYPGSSQINSKEIDALKKLESLPNGVVYTPPFNKIVSTTTPPLLSDTHDTAYITAYSGKQLYLGDVIQLDLLSIKYQDRLELMRNESCQILSEVSYLYEKKNNLFVSRFEKCTKKKISKIFENDLINLYTLD